jgi:hypothetical protein
MGADEEAVNQAERSLQQEVVLRLKAWPVIALPIPNGIWLPARSEQERTLVARVIRRMKETGMLTPGAPDLVLALRGGGVALVELKRPESRTLLGKVPAGRMSDAQKEMQMRAEGLGIAYCCVTSWEELRQRLLEWGLSPVGRAA